MDEPIADEVRGILDGHVILSRDLAARNQWPAIDVLPSLSRLMTAVADPEHRAAAARLRELLAAYERQRDLILLGAYQRGADPPPIAPSPRWTRSTTSCASAPTRARRLRRRRRGCWISSHTVDEMNKWNR